MHGAFLLFQPEQQTIAMMDEHDLIMIDEVGQLSRWVFERLMRLWRHASNCHAFVSPGDFCQLRGVHATRACDSRAWTEVEVRELKTMRRCECDEPRLKLQLLRAHKPSKMQLAAILKGHKAPNQHLRASHDMKEPTYEDISATLSEHPDTAFLVITKANAARINDWALWSLYGTQIPELVIKSDPEGIPCNFAGTKQVASEPMDLPVYSGARVTLTKNIHNAGDFVNGMQETIEDSTSGGISVRTKTNKSVVVFPWTDPDTKATYYPVTLGCASTLHKVQGQLLTV